MYEERNIPQPDMWITEQTDGSQKLHDPFDPDLRPLDPFAPSKYFYDSRLTDGMDYLRAVTGRDALSLNFLFTDGEEYRTDFGAEQGYFEHLVNAQELYAMGHTMPGTNSVREATHAGEYNKMGITDFRNEYHRRFHEAVAGRRLLFYAGLESTDVYGGPAGPAEQKVAAIRQLVGRYTMQGHVNSYALDITRRNFEQWYTVAKTGAELLALHESDAGHELHMTAIGLATPLANFDLIRKFVYGGSRLSTSATDIAGITAVAARNPYSTDFGEIMTVDEHNDTIALQTCTIPAELRR